MEKVTLLIYDPSSVKLDLKKVRVTPTPEGICLTSFNGEKRAYSIPIVPYKGSKKHFLCIKEWASSVDEVMLNSKPPELSSEFVARAMDNNFLRNVNRPYSSSEVVSYWRNAFIEALVYLPRRIKR